MKPHTPYLMILVFALCIFCSCVKEKDQSYIMVTPSERDLVDFLNSGDTIIYYDVVLSKHDFLTDLRYFKNLKRVMGNFEISGNTNLSSLSGLDSLKYIDGSFTISENKLITSLQGLGSLSSIKGPLFILSNNSLISLAGLESLSLVKGSLFLTNNSSLSDISGLKNLMEVEGGITISKKQNFYDLHDLNSELAFGDIHLFSSNLKSLEGISAGYRHNGEIWISNCSDLIDLKCFAETKIIEGKVTISDNRSLADLSAMCGVTDIEESLSLSNCRMSDLHCFDNLKSVEGNINIRDNDSLISLDGLNKLSRIKGELKISTNINLVDFCGIRNLLIAGYVGKSIFISQNKYNPTTDDIKYGECSMDSITGRGL